MANVFSTATLGLRLDTNTFNNAIRASGLVTQQAFASMSNAASEFEKKWDDATAGIKDTRRIISGILISQGFYGIMNAFTEGASAALTFSNNMETAAISTEYFVTGADKAAQSLAYLREMSEFAARTPFSTEAANELSKYIQSVGIGMNVSKSVLQVITDAAAATGATEETMQRIVFALGQMKTKGRIAGEEIRQLANANVPIYEILQEELGLTGEQISNIGSYWIDADKAIVAILDGLEKRYAGAADRIAETMTGMVDTIVDDALIIAYQAGDGIYGTFEDIIRVVRDKLDEYRDIATEFGAEGLFNHILLEIDPTGQFGTQLLTLVGNARQLISALSDLMNTSQPLINLFGNGLYGALGTVTVGATSLVHIVDDLEQLLSKLGITSGQTGRLLGELFVMYQAGKWAFTLGQGAFYAGSSLLQLGKTTISSLVPSMTAGSQSVLGLMGSLLALAAAGVAVYGILNNLGGFGGLEVNAGDILPSDYQSEMDRYLAEMEEYNNEIAKYQEQFNEPYSAIGEGTDKAIESYDDLKKASKSAAKSVQHDWVAAFDEVYQVPSWDDPSSGSGTTAELPELPDLGKLLNEITFSFPGIPEDAFEKPEFNWDEVFSNSFFDNDVFSGNWWRSMLPAAVAAGIAGMFTKRPNGPNDIPSGPTKGTNYVFDEKTIKQATVEFSNELKKLTASLDETRLALANGNTELPGTTAAHGLDSKTLLALADKLESSTKALDAAEQKMLTSGLDARKLPETVESQKYLAETEALRLELKDSNKLLADVRKELAAREEAREPIPVDLQKRLNAAEIENEKLKRQLAAHADTPRGTIVAQRQQAAIQVDQLRALGYEQRIRELNDTLEHIGDMSLGQRELTIKELGETKKKLDALVKKNDGINPKYSSLNPAQFIDEFGRMGDKLAETMQSFVTRKYTPGVAESAETFNKEAILALREQIDQFKLIGSYIQDNFSTQLMLFEDAAGTSRRVYAELMSQENSINKMFNQIARGSAGTKGEASPITVLKDLSKNIAGLTDSAIADEKLLAAQLEEAARVRQEAAAAREADRLEAQKRAAALRQAQAKEEFDVSGRALDARTQAVATEYIQDAIKASAEDIANQLREPLNDLVEHFKLTSGIESETVLKPGVLGTSDEVVKELTKPVNEALGEILNVLLDYDPDEVHFPDDVKGMLFEIIDKIDGDSDGYAKLLAEYVSTPVKPTTANIVALDIQDILHKAVRDTLGFAAPELLGRTPELMQLRNQLPGSTVGIGDIAGMLQGSSAFGNAAEVAERIGKALSTLDMSSTLRDASFTTTVAGELTRQISDLIRYSAAASLPAAGLTVHSGGIVESAGALLQVDAIAEGVVKGTSRSVPIQLIGVSDRVANQIAMLASTPVGGIAELDAAKLAAANSEAFYELGTLVKTLGTTDQNKGLKTGIIAAINRDLDLTGTRFEKAFVDRLGVTPKSPKPLSTESVMAWRNTRGLQDLSPDELVSDYVKRVLLPTFGFFPDVVDGNLTGTEAERLNEIFKDVNKTARQLNGSLDALKDSTQYYYVEFTSEQLDTLDLKNAIAGTNKHVQLLQDAFNTLGDTDELNRLMRSYAIMNANAGELAGAVLEVDFSAPIRQYTQLRQNANKWASDLLKADVKFSSNKAITSEFVAAVDSVMLQYFNGLDTALTGEIGTVINSAKAQLREIANNASGYLDLGSDVELAKRTLNALADNLEHIDPLSMTVRSYVDVLADFNRAIAADLPIDKRLAAQFDGLTRNVSNLIDRFGLESNEWIQGYVRNLSNLNERLRAAADALETGGYGANLSTIFSGPIDALMRIANSNETADLATNLFKSLTDGALDDAISSTVAKALQGVVPTPVHQASQAAKTFGDATIIDLETFGLPQATKGGTIYPEIFSGAMYNPSTGEMDRFYTLPDDILALIKQQGADSAAARSAVEKYIANIRSINADFRSIYGQPEITEDVIAKGISRADAVKKLTDWTTSNPNGFTGYNATNLGRVGGAFDTNTINAFVGTDVSKYAADDVMHLVTSTLRRYTGADTTLKLTELRDMFGISDELLQAVYGISESASHTAQADVLVTNEVLKRILGGQLDSIAAAGLQSGWKYTTPGGEVVKGIKDTLIGIGKAGDAETGLSADTLRTIYENRARTAGVSESEIASLRASYSSFIDSLIQNNDLDGNWWKRFTESDGFVDIINEAREAAEAVKQAVQETDKATQAVGDIGKAASDAAENVRRVTTASDLGDIAGTVGTARQAAVEDVGGPRAGNWLRDKINKLVDKITGRKTVDDYFSFDATKAASDTYESRVFNQHLFGGRKASAPSFDDIRLAFEDLRAADISPFAEFEGMTMQQIRANKNQADLAVRAGSAGDNTDWVKQARDMYDRALKESYGDVADNFYKTVVNHVAGQLKDGNMYASFDELLGSLNDDVKVFATTFGDKFGIIGDTLEITAKELKTAAFVEAFEKIAKAGNLGDALKNADNLASAVDILKQSLNGTMNVMDAARAFEQLTGDAKAFNNLLGALDEIKDVRQGLKTLDQISDTAKTFIDGINEFGSEVVVMRSTAAGLGEVADDVLFSGKQAAQAVNAAADTVSNSFKTVFHRMVDGVANFGIIDIAVAGVTAAIQHAVDEANIASLQASMELRDETGSAALLAGNGYKIGEVIGDDIYHGAAQEFGNAIASGAVSSIGATAGFALGGKVGDVIGSALGTAVAGPLGTIVGKVVGTGIGMAVGALAGKLADNVIDNMGGHSATNLYLDDYLTALSSGSLITADALDDMCISVGMAAEELEGLSEGAKKAALAERGVDVEAIEELARNINTNVTMGSADYSKYMEKDDINRILTGTNSHANYTPDQIAARLTALYGGFGSGVFSNGTVTYSTPYSETGSATANAMLLNTSDMAAAKEALAELSKYLGKELELREYQQTDEYGITQTVQAVTDDKGNFVNYSFADLDGLEEAIRLTYTQGNTVSDISRAISETINGNRELRNLVAANLGEGMSGQSIIAAYNNLEGYLKLFNSAAGTQYTLADLAVNWELGTHVQSFASQYNEVGVDELLRRLEVAASDVSLYNAKPQFEDTSRFVRGEGFIPNMSAIPGTVLNGGKQTLWGADLSSLLPEYLEEFKKVGFTLDAGSIMGQTVLSDPQAYNYATLSTDPEIIKEALTGWRIDMSNLDLNGLDFSNLSITAKDAEILASAGIQINSDGTITFMKADQASITGSERSNADLDPTVFSQYVLDTLKGASLEINFEAGELKFDPKEVGSNIYGAMFKLPDDWKRVAEPEIQSALSELGDVMDSGYIMITDKAVLNGEQTIEGFVRGMVGDERVNDQVADALGGIDELIHQEGQSVVDNITEWADAITIPSPFQPEELNEEMKAMFETMGIHFVEYGDEFLMQINQTGEHIKDGCVMLDADYWNQLPESLRGALEEMGVVTTEVGNQVMIDLSSTMEAGIGNIVSLYTERPDLWDQLPEAVKTALQACIIETDNGMLELINASESKLVQVGETWVTSWETISADTLNVLGMNNQGVAVKLDELRTAVDSGLVQVVGTITEKDLPTIAENEIAIPFSELPADIRQSLTGAGGLSSAMEDGLIVVKNVEQDQLAEIVGAAQGAATDVGAAGADIVAQITEAVREAGIQLQSLQSLQSQAGKSGGFFGIGATQNTQGGAYVGTVNGEVADVVAEYDSKGNFLFYRYKIRSTGTTGTTTSKPTPYTSRASGGPASGLTLTGELGTEMAILPDGSIRMLGASGKGELVDLPAGTRVLNAEDTKEILKYTGPINSVPKLAEGNTDLMIQQPEEDQMFKAAMLAFMKAMAGQQTTNDAETDLAVTTDPMITVVDDATKQLKEGNEVAIHGAVATIQETMTLYSTQELSTLDNGFNNVIAAISERDATWANQFKLFEENLAKQLTTINTSIGDGFAQMSSDHTDMVKDLIEAIQDARDEIVKAIKSMGLGGSSSSSSSSASSGSSYGGTGSSRYGSGYSDSTTFITDGVSVYEISSGRASRVVTDSTGNVDWSATAVAFAAMGDWAGAVEAMNNRVQKIAALGTDYGVSNEDVYNQALEAYNKRIVSFSDYAANVKGYSSIGNVQSALDEFDKRGYKISVTGDDGGLSQEELWNQSLRGWTGISYMQWMSLHEPGTYSAYSSYDQREVDALFDSDAPVITDAMDKNLKDTAQTILNGENVQMDNFMDFCGLLASSGYANVDKNVLEQIQAGHEDTVAITDAIELLKDAFSNRTSGVTGTLEYLAEKGMQGIYDNNNWVYSKNEGDMYGGGWSGSGLVVDLATDYHALMNAAAAAGDWSAFDEAAAKRDAKIQYEGNGNAVSSTSSIAQELEDKYKRNGSARGSLISEEGLYYAGEEGKQEAIIPLEQPEVLDKLGNAIGPYVDGNNVFDYTGAIDDASVVIKEGNEVAIHGAVAALLEGQGSSNQTLLDQSITNKDEILTAIKANTDAIVAAIGSLATKISSAASSSSSSSSAAAQQSSSGYSGGGSSRPQSYTPSVTTPSTNSYYNSNTDYHALMNQYAAAGNWSAFDDAAAKRDLKMANDASLSKWEATDTLREQLESLYKRHGSASGSIISEEGLYYAGEKDRQEAIIPLEDPQALDKVGQAIGQYTDFQQAYIDYTGDIKDASKVVKEGNEVAIHGAVAALLEGWTNGNDELITLLNSHKDEIIAAINGVGTTITGSLNSMITSLKSSMSSGSSSSAAQQSSGYSSGGSTSRPQSYTPSVTTPSSNSYYNSNTDYHALMNQYAAAGNWTAFDDAAAKRDLKMANDSSLSKWEATSTLREQLESLYKRNGSANGSIISEEGLYYAGEKNKQEAIIPLENPQALDKVGRAISEYTDFQQAYIDYTGDIGNASKTIKEGNEVAIHGAVAALLEGWTTSNDTLVTLITSSKDEIIAAINGVGTTITGSLSGLISSMQSMASSAASSSGAPAQTSSGGYSGGSSSRPTSYTPSVSTPTANAYYNSNTDYHALMNAAAAAGDWSAFDDAAAKRDLKMAADSSLGEKYSSTDTLREQLEKEYKRNGSAMGSLISSPGLYYAGEMGLDEAIVPLEQPQVLRKVGASIASFMPVDMQQQMSTAQGLTNGGIGTTATYAPQPTMDPSYMTSAMIQGVLESVLPQIANQQGEGNNEDKRPLYVGTLIADDRGLKQLERKLYDIRQVEAGRH